MNQKQNQTADPEEQGSVRQEMAESDFIPLHFDVRRREPELVAPGKPTPCEFKQLSKIDNQENKRFHIWVVNFYPHNPLMPRTGRDPAKIIKDAVSQALVFYYPFAGRLREMPNGKMAVECNGEGILFTEAIADVTIQRFGDPIRPPFPCMDDLLYNVPGCDGILHTPLLLIQVTRLRCGGFIFGIRLNHVISDATGLAQFMRAVGEIARGASAPSIPPVWQRELLNARDPQCMTSDPVTQPSRNHNHADPVRKPHYYGYGIEMAHRSFFFGPSQMSAIRKLAPRHPPSNYYTTFELLTSCFWRCCVLTFRDDPNEEVRLFCAVNARSKLNPPLPVGYYGNAYVDIAASATAEKVSQGNLGHALDSLKKAKARVTKDYMRSQARLSEIRSRGSRKYPDKTGPDMVPYGYRVSDVSRVGFEEADFGWGKAAYGGNALAWFSEGPAVASSYVKSKNKKGEAGILMVVALPAPIMERFAATLESVIKNEPPTPTSITSSL